MTPLTRVVDAQPHPNRTEAVLDRVLQNVHRIELDGESYRMRAHRARAEHLRQAVSRGH